MVVDDVVVVEGLMVTVGRIIGAMVVVVVFSGATNTRIVVVVDDVDVVEVAGTVVDVVSCASVVLLTPTTSTTSTFLSEPQNMHPHNSATASNTRGSLMDTH